MIFNSYAEQREELAGMRLVSCGHIFAKPQREIFRPAGREDWLLFYVAREQETFFIDGTVTADAGSFILFAPGETQHHIYQGTKTAEFYYVHFQCRALPAHISLETSRVYPLTPQQQFSAVFEEIIEQTMQKRPHYEMLCITRLLYLLVQIQRESDGMEDAAGGRWRSVAHAIQHMNKYCDSNLRLKDYADMYCMSKYYFLRVFKQVTGVTPLEYRSRIRIEHAKELLEDSSLSVFEIGETLGYTSPAYFSGAFKKVTGMSPMAYRSRNGRL